MTNSRSLSWIDRGRWEGLLARVTDEPAPAYRPPRPPRPAPRATPAWTLPPIKPAAGNGPATIQISVPPAPPTPAAPRRARSNTSPIAARPRHTTGPLPNVPLPPAAAPGPAAAPVPAAAPPRPAYRPFVAPSRQLEERLQALVAWIEDCVPCRAAFIADDNGLPVVEHVGAEAGHVAAASSILLMLASVRTLMRDSGGWLSLKLGAQVLNVVEVATRWGRFGIGVVTEDALPREFLLALSDAVERAFHGEPSPGEAT
jgi:hypothetical protein